jgi:hypothetical protein
MEDPETLPAKSGGDGEMMKRPDVKGVEDALLDGDLSNLSPQQRLDYYRKVCESVGLNPLTKPFEYIRLNGQLTLYAKRDAAEQLRSVHGISITDMEETWRDDIIVVRAYAKTEDGRTDVATGAVDTSRSSGQDLANDIMKAETKAKRRVTLSLAGLGWLDETEVQDIPDSATQEVEVDYETGEVIQRKPDGWYQQASDWLVQKVQDGTDAADIISNAGKVPSDHPLDEWPEEWAEETIERLKTAEADRVQQEAEGVEEEAQKAGPDEVKKAAENVETASAEANDEAFEDDEALPF